MAGSDSFDPFLQFGTFDPMSVTWSRWLVYQGVWWGGSAFTTSQWTTCRTPAPLAPTSTSGIAVAHTHDQVRHFQCQPFKVLNNIQLTALYNTFTVIIPQQYKLQKGFTDLRLRLN